MNPTARELERYQLILATLHREERMRVDDLAARVGMTRAEVVQAVERLQMVHGADDDTGSYVDIDLDGPWVDMPPRMDLGLGRRPLPLTTGEYVALAAAVRAVADVPLRVDAEAVLRRVAAGLAPSLRDRVDRIRDRLEIGGGRVSDPVMATLEAALRAGEDVEIEYLVASRDELTQRTVAPRELWGRDGTWYLRAGCNLRGDERLFRLDRVVSARRTGKASTRAGSRPAAPGARPSTDAPAPTRHADVRFDGPAAAWARERHPAADVTERPDGSVVVRVPCPSPVWLAGWVVSFAGRARVIGPPELRAEVARRLKTAFGRTAAGSGLATLVDTPVPLR